MRQIRFRGKKINTNEWVYGTYHYSNDQKHHYILAREKFIDADPEVFWLHGKEVVEVIPETVGEFTGLILDEGLTPVFEGDIVSEQGAYVLWDNEIFCWCFNFPFSKTPNVPLFYNDTIQTMKVVGTIHD